MNDRFPAITLHQPWANLVAHHGKDIENRTWPPPAKLIGRRIAIHAAKNTPQSRVFAAWDWLEKSGFSLFPAIPPGDKSWGAVLAVATLEEYRLPAQPETYAHQLGSRWWMRDHYGWILADVVALPEPIPCRGWQRIWYLPDDVAAKLEGL